MNTRNSFGFIVPFLNGATWLSSFLAHYKPILGQNKKNRMILVEGATSFHSSAEHRLGLSIDGSNEIIDRMKTDSIIHIQRGRVGFTSELLNEGLVHCSHQDFIMPLTISDFVTKDAFRGIDELHNIPDLISIPMRCLIGDFKHCLNLDDRLFAFANIEGLSFKSDMMPYFEDKRLDEIGKITAVSTVGSLNVSRIETQYQFGWRTNNRKKYLKWYHTHVAPLSVDFEKYSDIEMNERGKSILYSGSFPFALKGHEWFDKNANEIWNHQTVFPRFCNLSKSVPEKNILEIGCATGQTLKYYQERGWRAIGIEPSLWASGYGRHILNVDVHTGCVSDYQFNDGEFSVIVFWDSFEHVPNPIETLEHIRPWLACEGGKLMIYTPDVSKWCDDKRHFLWSPQQHFFLYTPETLTLMLEKVGFKIISVDKKIDNHGFLIVAKKESWD